MYNLSAYDLKIGRGRADIHDWFLPVFERGRGAVFVDTSFLRALIDGRDQYHATASSTFEGANANFYTTALVLAETVRQIVKNPAVLWLREQWLDRCKELTAIGGGRVVICVPPRELVLECYEELLRRRLQYPKLDLCDMLSVAVLDYARHKRVFGFDQHFSQCGAQLEPIG